MENFRTANSLEDLDFVDELNSYHSVGHAVDRSSFWGIEEEYTDVDFYIIMLDNTEEKEIRQLLSICGYSAWFEYEDKMVKHPSLNLSTID